MQEPIDSAALSRSFPRRLFNAICSVFRNLWRAIGQLTFFELAIRVALFLVSLSVIAEITNNAPVLDVVSLPKELQDRGYTSEFVARAVNDQITAIEDSAQNKAKQERQQLHPEQDPDAQRQLGLLTLAADEPLLVLQVPGSNISLKAVILFVRQLLHIPPDRITIDAIFAQPFPNPGAAKESDEGELNLRIFVRRIPKDNSPPIIDTIETADVSKVLSTLAECVLADAEPQTLKVALIASGNEFRSNGDYAEAVARYQRALRFEISPNVADQVWDFDKSPDLVEVSEKDSDLGLEISNTYVSWGHALYAQGRIDEAAKKYRAATHFNENPEAYAGLAKTLDAVGDYKGAIDDYLAATDFAFDDTGTYAEQANNDHRKWSSELCRKGDFKNAVEELRAVDDANGEAMLYVLWGRFLEVGEAHSDAVDKYKKALNLFKDEQDGNVYYSWAYALDRLKRRSEAEEKHRLAIELRPHFVDLSCVTRR
jgi:tetratricopeptide (TPR) repeat protein